MVSLSVREVLSLTPSPEAEVQVQGWVRSRRDSKAGLSFITLSDGSCAKSIQLIVPAILPNYAEILKLSSGCSIEAVGLLVASPGAGQIVEIQVRSLSIVGGILNPESYPISKKHHTVEYLREVAHLRPRTQMMGAVMRVRDCLSQGIHRFLHEQGFYWIHTPLMTCSDCEGAGKTFRVTTLSPDNPPRKSDQSVDFSQDFFGRETFLTVSGQLNLESYCMALSKVYSFGPVFRAEPSNTPRHLAESWMLEPEIAFADLNADIDLEEALLKSVLKTTLRERADDMAFFAEQVRPDAITRIERVIDRGLARISYTEAIERLERSGENFEFPVHWGIDLQSEHERYLAEKVFEGPVAVMHYPKGIKAFYMRVNDDGRTVAAADLLVPGLGELSGGSQREERYDVLVERMKELHLDPKPYEWYLDLRRYGSVPHAGFGMGVDRLVCYVTGIPNIREAIPFPRYPQHAEF